MGQIQPSACFFINEVAPAPNPTPWLMCGLWRLSHCDSGGKQRWQDQLPCKPRNCGSLALYNVKSLRPDGWPLTSATDKLCDFGPQSSHLWHGPLAPAFVGQSEWINEPTSIKCLAERLAAASSSSHPCFMSSEHLLLPDYVIPQHSVYSLAFLLPGRKLHEGKDCVCHSTTVF